MTIKDEYGRLFNTDKAKASWDAASDWDGSNDRDRNTGSQWSDQTLYLSSKGTYYTVTTTRVQGHSDYMKVLDEREAATWLEFNDHELPEGMESVAE